MAISFYDDALIYKLNKWMPEKSKLRILGPNETKKLFELNAEDEKEKPLKLPFIALSRNNDVELLLNIKNEKSFSGIKLVTTEDKAGTAQWNVIPIKLVYQMDIYAKTAEDCEEYVRNFLFKIINNPALNIGIPYNNLEINHIAYIRVLSTVSDTSEIQQRLFSGQFHRWTLQLEIQDAFLFNIPYRKNWKVDGISLELDEDISSQIEKDNEEPVIESFSELEN